MRTWTSPCMTEEVLPHLHAEDITVNLRHHIWVAEEASVLRTAEVIMFRLHHTDVVDRHMDSVEAATVVVSVVVVVDVK